MNKKDPDVGTKVDSMIEDTSEDIDNGLYEGWVMAADITDRDHHTTMHYNYLSISPQHIAFRAEKTGEPFMRFKTSDMHYACAAQENNCALMEYLGHQIDSGVSFEAQHTLTKLNKILLGQLTSADPTLCLVLEFQDAIIRSVRSVAVCLFRVAIVAKVQMALNTAYYTACKEGKPMTDFPMISLDNEVFPIKVYDEGQVIKETGIFEEKGIYKYNKNKSLRKLLLEFGDILPDKAGKTCAFWYHGLTVPDALEMTDSNCCFQYKKSLKKQEVYVCSTHAYRCIYF